MPAVKSRYWLPLASQTRVPLAFMIGIDGEYVCITYWSKSAANSLFSFFLPIWDDLRSHALMREDFQ